jgi:hypothetical protein
MAHQDHQATQADPDKMAGPATMDPQAHQARRDHQDHQESPVVMALVVTQAAQLSPPQPSQVTQDSPAIPDHQDFPVTQDSPAVMDRTDSQGPRDHQDLQVHLAILVSLANPDQRDHQDLRVKGVSARNTALLMVAFSLRMALDAKRRL